MRDVIKQNYLSRVEAEIPFKSKEPQYIGSFQRAVTAVLNKMTEEDLEEAENILELWNKEGGPSNVQLKWVLTLFVFGCYVFKQQFRRAKTKLPKEIKNMVEKWKFSSGAAIMCLVAYPDGDDVQSFQ
jgi:hypothetical protein